MCGIAASVRRGSEGRVAWAAEMMGYRGVRVKHAGVLSHVRLPIVGLGEEFDQPMRAGEWLVAFVGELLDFREADPGAECDADLVAAAWASKGPVGLRDRDGFWSVVAIREDRRELSILCDYLAQKPFYYRLDEAACASELDAIASFGPVTPDLVYLASCRKWGYCPDPRRTPYAEVSRVLPGECVTLDDQGRIDRRIVDSLVPRGSLADLREEVEKAVRRRVLSADVPVACLLSGGLDSSIVYSLAARHGSVVPYFVQGPDLEGGEEEREDALRVVEAARQFPLGVVKMGNFIPKTIGQLVSVMQEPIDLGSLAPQVFLSEVVEERVCLTGDGADEFFGGYGRAMRYDSQASDVFQELVCWHLPRLDRVMMRRAIEVRSPFLARRVCEVALSLPRSERTGKKCLRDAFKDLLPARILEKPKVPLRVEGVGEEYRVALVDAFVGRIFLESMARVFEAMVEGFGQ